jgi:hypothetical protein
MFSRISDQQRKFKKNAKNIALGRKDQLCEWEVSSKIGCWASSKGLYKKIITHIESNDTNSNPLFFFILFFLRLFPRESDHWSLGIGKN